MKKFLLIILALAIFCSCSENQPVEEPQSEPEPEISENPLPDGAELAGMLGEEEIYAVETETITKKHRLFDNDGKQYLAETERSIYRLLDSEGNMIIPHPVEDFYLSEPGDRGNSDKYLIYCTYNGNYYIYEKENGYIPVCTENCGATGEYLNGFEKTAYCWGAFYPEVWGIGLNDSEGNVFLEPIYMSITAPFEDRFIIKYGLVPQSAETQAEKIIDLEGNVICDAYNSVYFYFLEDGSYIGVACCTGGKRGTEVYCRAENGELYEEGFWFVDKDGNKLSEKFSDIRVERLGYGENLKLGETVMVVTENGEEQVLPIGTYAIES